MLNFRQWIKTCYYIDDYDRRSKEEDSLSPTITMNDDGPQAVRLYYDRAAEYLKACNPLDLGFLHHTNTLTLAGRSVAPVKIPGNEQDRIFRKESANPTLPMDWVLARSYSISPTN
ncbi:hypothetical protein PM082_008145 [Marasmius tenuissimus]|nr:hypothetical protein PM082_008145 [Marasmius tenuissimus]